MSAVIIAGDTSGTITLNAPSVSGTTTLTLPTTSGTILTTANTFGAGTGPAFSAYAVSNQSVSNTTFTKATFGTELFDTNNNFASSTFTPTVAGYYQINALIRTVVTSGAITNAIVSIYKNGSSYKRGTENSSGKINNQVLISDIVYCNGTTDYVEIYGFIEGTSPSFNYISADITSYFSGFLARSA